jgi:hypothetical protein
MVVMVRPLSSFLARWRLLLFILAGRGVGRYVKNVKGDVQLFSFAEARLYPVQ